MTQIRPFRALRYDASRVSLAKVIVPPYDVIAAGDREGFYARDPHNAIRLELTRRIEDEAGADYADVSRTLAAWTRSGVLAQDPRPAFYALRQSFTGPDGKAHVRDGFFGLLHLEDYARRGVRPHERTLAGPKADRLKMLRATRANLSIVFLLYEDREETLLRRLAPALEAEPLAEATDEAGATHRLARIDDPGEIEALRAFFATRPLVIADGHHRYETALAYRDEQRAAHPEAGPDAPFEWILAYFANAFAPGSLLLPIHRLILRGEKRRAGTTAARGKYHCLERGYGKFKRVVHIAGITTQPNESWMMQVARNLTDKFGGFLMGKSHLILDRDTKYTAQFRLSLPRTRRAALVGAALVLNYAAIRS
jgi:uncharacterized protein (DUF1015 family)